MSASPGNFNPRSPRGGATGRPCRPDHQGQEFQSTLPTRGSDAVRRGHNPREHHFNPRSPRGGATQRTRYAHTARSRFQSTLPTRGSDTAPAKKEKQGYISIHAPHEGERQQQNCQAAFEQLFQSTLPTRGSDNLYIANKSTTIYFNPRSPRGGATTNQRHMKRFYFISIHAPHEGERRAARYTG